MGRRLLYVVTHGLSARHLLRGQLAWMRRAGYTVAVVAAPGADLEAAAEREGVEALAVPMAREIAPVADAASLARLVRLMRSWRPDVVNAGTPKAGLLGMLAARAVGVPARVYTLRGLRLETAAGAQRRVLEATERLAAASAHRVLVVSPSLAGRYTGLGLAPAQKVRVLAAGSSNGIDAARFAPRPAEERSALRERLGLPLRVPVVGFVGRLTRDKGVVELVDAFHRLRARHPEARLLLVGDFEAGDPVPEAVADAIRSDPAIVRTGFVPDAAPYYGLMTVLAFPSYREGFPNVPLEAAAAGLPVAGFRATGTVDAVADGATGMLVPPGDAGALAEALGRYLHDPVLAALHGGAGRDRAARAFAPERIWEALAAEYDALLRPASR